MTDVTDGPRSQYEIVAAAIREIEARAEGQPSLDEVADAVGLSPAHFQRVFSRFVGVSPKKYLQFLTLEHAKHLLAERFTVLDVAHEVGLSGPSRLHDLFITWESMTPGDYARRGKGVTILWGWFESPFGRVLAMATEKGICGMAFAAEAGEDFTLADMRGRWPAAVYREAPAELAPRVEAAFGGPGELHLALFGAPFQIQVWQALLSVPPGHVTTYSEIARHVGKPRAVRAVGTAVGRNPISWLIPCHRALRRDGELGGYHWGLPVKRAMLAWESALTEG